MEKSESSTEKTTKEVLARIDQNIGYNVLDFRSYNSTDIYDENGSVKTVKDPTGDIIKNLLIYFCASYQSKDLFGYRKLDPRQFAETMKMSLHRLQQTHPNPRQLKDSPNRQRMYDLEEQHGKFSNYRIADSYIENALYILRTIPIFNKYKGSTKDNDFIGEDTFLMIESVRMVAKKTAIGRNKKITYEYKLNEMFENNMRRFFTPISINTYNLMRSKKAQYEDLYLHISGIYHSRRVKGFNSHKWTLQTLAKRLNINDFETMKPSALKSRISRKMKIILSLMPDQIPGLIFEWQKGSNNKYYYTPAITWNKEELETVKKEGHDMMHLVFLNHLRRILIDTYINQIDTKGSQDGFYAWLVDKENKKIVKSAYESTYLLNKKRPVFPNLDTLASSFYNSLIKVDLDSIHKVFDGGIV